MSRTENLLLTIGKSLLSRFGAKNELAENSGQKDRKRWSYKLNRIREYQFEPQIKDLNDAIAIAEDFHNPRRFELLQIYRETMRDFHLKSQINTAIYKVISEPWAIVKKDLKTIDADATLLLQRKWFEDLCWLVLEAEYYGYSLIEFGQLIMHADSKALEFKEVKEFPREHVCPEKGTILITPTDTSSQLYYMEPPFNKWLLFAGDTHDLGLLHIASKHAIYKKWGLADWSRSVEKWSDPILVIRSASDSQAENDKKAEMAANFGNNGWALLDDDDQIELLERSNSQGVNIFKDFMQFNNDENSKGVNGQVATSDEKAFVGSAEVQERILNDYTTARLRNLMYFINETLIPYLVQVNAGKTAYTALKDTKWVPLRFMKQEKEESDTPPAPKEGEEGGKKSLGGFKP